MRISNINQYLGGADNVIAREIIEGDQLAFEFNLGSQDFSAYTFEVDTQLFTSQIETRGSTIEFTQLDAVMPASTHTYQSDTDDISDPTVRTTKLTNGGIVLDENDNTKANLIIPTTLLSDLTTENAPANSETPYVVAMSITLNSNGSNGMLTNIKQTFRMLWIIRYRPMA